MKLYLKLISLMLTLTILSASLLACDSGETENTTESNAIVTTEPADTSKSETESETESAFFPDVASKDYGADFFLSIQPDSNYMEYHWVEESANDALSQAIYDRQQKVFDFLGVDIIANKTLTSKQYVDPFKIAVKSKDGSVDALLTHHYHGIDSFISENYLADFNSFSQLDLSADYWNAEIMEEVALGGRMYLGKSDFNILCTHVITINKDMMDKYADSLDETVYEMVDNYRWTLDQMISLANLVYIDEGSDGHTINDTFGIIGEQDAAFCGFLLASDIVMIEPNEEGKYVLSVYNDKNRARTTDLIEKLRNLAKDESSWFWKWGENDKVVNFHENTSLLGLTNTNRLPYYLNYDVNFGVLPYPMYDESQKDVGYRSLQFGGFTCIPSFVSNPEMVGDTLEMLSFYSEEVNIAFYEKLLGKQVADAPLDTKMLEIVWEGIGTDFAQTFYSAFLDTNIFHMMPHLTYADATDSVASFVAAKENMVNKKIDKFIRAVEKMK